MTQRLEGTSFAVGLARRRFSCRSAWFLGICAAVVLAAAGCGGAAQHSVTAHTIQIAPPRSLSGPLPLDASRAQIRALAVPMPADGEQVAVMRPVANEQSSRAEAEAEAAELDAQVMAAAGGSATDEGTEPASPLEQVAAEAPDDGLPEVPMDPGLRKNAEGEVAAVPHDLPLTVNDVVLSFLNYFQTPRGRAIVETGLRRAGRYRPMIERVLREEGLPSDLMYMAQAESAFQPQALSRAGARGLWQFMSYRGKQYGLEHSWYVDDRQDPEKATRAAAHHLRDLYELFGDWYLVMAAYNSGPGTVEKAVEHTGYADFWQLYRLNALPKETRNYVPIILALTLIAKDPARYGVDVDPDEPLPADTVQLGHPVDLRLVSEALDVDLDTLRALNPQLLRLITPADPQFALRVPVGTAEDLRGRLADIPADKWTLWRLHAVEDGETVSTIARKYHVQPAELVAVNSLDPRQPLDAGIQLILPLNAIAQPASGAPLRYRVRGTDTLASIADEFDVTVPELKKWNHLRADKLPAGVRLRIYPGGLTPPPEVAQTQKPAASQTAVVAEWRAPAKPAPKAEGSGVTHRVQAGETLYSIARTYQTTVDALRKGNQFLFSRPLQAGDTLTILPAR